MLVIDSTEGITHQDQRLAERIDAAGCPIVIVLNKWELLDTEDRARVTGEVQRRLAFLGESEIIRISALTGRNVHRLLPILHDAIEVYHRRIPTRKVNDVVADAQAAQPAPHGGRILYATQGATDPPTFTLFANKELPASYLRFIERRLREAFEPAPPHQAPGPEARHLNPMTDVQSPRAERSDFTTPETGLTAAQVRERMADGRTNAVEEHTSRTIGEIVRANVLTRFNAMLSVIALAVLATGRVGDMLFAGVLVLNSAIGILQEVRAKRTLDRLALLHAPTATVIRDGEMSEVPIAEVVLDDLIELTSGDQVPADGHLSISDGVEIDESNLTGESDPVPKAIGDDVMSGTAVVAGKGYFQARAVGEDAYARQIAAEVKTFKRAHSELEHGINTILRYITWVIVVVSPFLLWGQFNSLEDDQNWQDAVTGTAAALVGMVPEGLVLLTSLSFGLAALALTRRQVLVQELPAVEGLARVDVVCLDKTGTLTDGNIAFDELIPLEGADEDAVAAALGSMAHQTDPNASLAAIGDAYDDADGWDKSGEVPFSSARKWSAMAFGAHQSWFLGAPDMLLDDDDPLRDRVADLAAEGRRVLLLQCSGCIRR